MGLSKDCSNDDRALYLAFLAYKLHDSNNDLTGELIKHGHGPAVLKYRLCNYDPLFLIMDAIKRYAPKLYKKGESIHQHVVRVEKYLFNSSDQITGETNVV